MTSAFERLSAALSDRYRIERPLGAGGMATVYLAHDFKHDRQVAVKVLKPELAVVLGGDRFLQEIKTTANLQHPNILPLFDSGEADGFLYYVMPFVEGETLRDRLHRDRQLAVDDAVGITKAVAGALDYAHKRGVIHRDIKPENILLQDGVALVADFGIALAVKAAGGERLTETGLSLGTPAYMSPEQIAGERSLDARSDVYSLACVTYEMLAGDPPFVSSSAQAVMAKHVTDPAPPITTTRPNVTRSIAAALAKALSKAPADRYGSAGAFSAALAAQDAAAESDPKSLVVLPFVNQSPDPDNEYFADGLTEEIIGDLSRLRDLRVISRNSAMALKGTRKDTPTLARELHVSHVVTGSVRRAGNALRVSAELVEAASDTPVWSDKYSGTLEDVFGIQEEIARKVVGALRMTLTDQEAGDALARPIDNAVAHDCYLRARQAFTEWTPEAMDRAVGLVDSALAIVGDNPLLLATKANIYWSWVNVLIRPDERWLDEAEDLVRRALAIDADHYLAIYVRGIIAGLRGRREQAVADLHRAHLRRPGDANVLAEIGRFFPLSGLESLSYAEAGIRIDPLTPLSWLAMSNRHYVAGEHDKAVPAARRAMEVTPGSSPVHVFCAWEIAGSGLHGEALGVLSRMGTDLDGTAPGALARFLAHALQGDEARAVAQFTPDMEHAFSLVEAYCWLLTDGYALLGRRDDALRWLARGIDRGLLCHPFLARTNPFLESLRGDQRFQKLMDRLQPRWEALVAWQRGLPA